MINPQLWKCIAWIQPIPLLVGFLLGLVAVLFHKPPTRIVYEYPKPGAANDAVYKDRGGTCFQYVVTEVDCKKREADINEFPLQ